MTWFPLSDIDWMALSTPFDSQPDYAKLVGLVVERWSMLEQELARTLECLLSSREAADAIFYTIVSNKTRVDIIRALALSMVPDGPEKDGLFSLLDRVESLNKRRNDIIHGTFHTGIKQMERLQIRPRRNKREWTGMGDGELREHVRMADRLVTAFSFANAEDPDHWIYRRPRSLAHLRSNTARAME